MNRIPRICAIAILFALHMVTVSPAVSAPNAFTLIWTAPGDDGVLGRATAYDLRYSTTTITPANFAQATPLTGLPLPAVAGTTQSFVVSGLNPGSTYYLAIKTRDEVGNWSTLSNVHKFVGQTTGSGTPLFTLSFSGPWPNPVQSSMNCSFTLPAAAAIRVEVYDLSGRLLKTLAEGRREAGEGDLTWDLSDRDGRMVHPGVYLLRAQLGPRTWTRRVSVVR